MFRLHFSSAMQCSENTIPTLHDCGCLQSCFRSWYLGQCTTHTVHSVHTTNLTPPNIYYTQQCTQMLCGQQIAQWTKNTKHSTVYTAHFTQQIANGQYREQLTHHIANGSNGASSKKTNYIDIFSEILNLEGHLNCCISSKVRTILLNGWPLPTGRVASGRVWHHSHPDRKTHFLLKSAKNMAAR